MFWRLLIGLPPLLLSGCSFVSLENQVRSASVDYATVFEEYNNQGILKNILRASEEAPLNFADLPILHGSLSFNASLTSSFAFGDALHGKGFDNTISPALSFTTSPTFDTSPLNTSGFSLLLLQPISPTFIVNAWQSGISKELLLRLFVESIEFKKCNKRVRVENDINNVPLSVMLHNLFSVCRQSDTTKSLRFTDLIENAIRADLDLRLFTVYLPLGSDYSTPAMKDLVDASTSADAAGLHVGNEGGGKLQVYRSLAGLTVGCLNLDVFNDLVGKDFAIYDALAGQIQKPSAPAVPRAAQNHAVGPEHRAADHGVASPEHKSDAVEWPSGLNSFFQNLKPEEVQNSIKTGRAALLSGAGPGGMGSSGNGAGAGSKAGSTGAAPTSQTTPGPSQQSQVQPGQTSAIVGDSSCLRNPLVLKPATELDASLDSEEGIVIHWRSIIGVFHFLGEIVNAQGDPQTKPLDLSNPSWSWAAPGGSREVLFDLARDGQPTRVATNYRGKDVGVPFASADSGPSVVDHSLAVMALLTRLLNDSRISGDIPTTQRLEVVP